MLFVLRLDSFQLWIVARICRSDGNWFLSDLCTLFPQRRLSIRPGLVEGAGCVAHSFLVISKGTVRHSFPIHPLILFLPTVCMASAAQQPQTTIAGRRGCNNPSNKRAMTKVWLRGKHEATVRDSFFSNSQHGLYYGTEHCLRSFLFIIRRWIQITFSPVTVPQ